MGGGGGGGSIAIDWGSLDDDFAEVVVVPSSATTTYAASPEIAALPDKHLREKIQRLRGILTNAERLPDGGHKLRNSLHHCQAELHRRQSSPFRKDDRGQEKTSHPTKKESLYRCSEPTLSIQRSYGSYNTPLSVKNFYGKEKVAFESEFNLLGRDKCKTMEKGKTLQASRDTPSRSFSDRGCNRGKGKNEKSSREVPSRSLSDRIRSRVRSAGYKDLSAFISSKRRKVSESSSDSDSEKVTDVVLLDDDDVETPEQTPNKEVPDKWKESKMYYPSRKDPEAIELDYSDIKCLEPGQYLSSPVINFYIQYLKQSLSQTSRWIESFYIFNTYFYQKLEEALDGKDDHSSLFMKLRRWWKGVNIFEKAYIILPIHGSLHWSLVIICIPEQESQLGPTILHLDSLGCHSSGPIFNTIERYLKKEWQQIAQINSQSSLPRIRKEKAPVPRQENEYDCGLFVLYFIERFIKDSPDRFRKHDLAMFGRKWFKPEEASSLRQRIRNLLVEELEIVPLEEGIQNLDAVSCSSDSN
ncbi:Sentrin-specific protease 2 [Rhynchospora pubera]|uniref:Sentrin-specific protease 2 n=1 Tax=Rhynchospora pubera TaxID=906938 RepID=A0AAV8HZ10_9POAL|nr:Sentrin-specific protease 2 [Rhynchospora pubera]